MHQKTSLFLLIPLLLLGGLPAASWAAPVVADGAPGQGAGPIPQTGNLGVTAVHDSGGRQESAQRPLLSVTHTPGHWMPPADAASPLELQNDRPLLPSLPLDLRNCAFLC